MSKRLKKHSTNKSGKNGEEVELVGRENDDEIYSSVYLSQEAGSTRAGKSSKVASTVKGSSKGARGKKSNTVVQQINDFSLTPMNDVIADETLEDHKYLLLEVQNRAAIAYFAAANRNLSLFNSLVKYIQKDKEEREKLSSENLDSDGSSRDADNPFKKAKDKKRQSKRQLSKVSKSKKA